MADSELKNMSNGIRHFNDRYYKIENHPIFILNIPSCY